MGGPIASADACISTARMTRVLEYEPRDLTISVEAGMGYRDLQQLLAKDRQMIPLDPPFADGATIGGVIAANCSGPRRRLYGSARDLVIGMKFATLEGKLVQSGGMVVKNVAGLDMGKLLIGSFGTLGGIAVLNFKLVPMPEHEQHFVLNFDSADDAVAARDRILKSVLQPASLDLLNPAASALCGLSGYCLAIQTGGNQAVIQRYTREFDSAFAPEGLERRLQEFTPAYLESAPQGAVARISCTLREVGDVIRLKTPVVARAGSGVCYAHYQNSAAASEALDRWKAILEFSPPDGKAERVLWPAPGSDLDLMKRVKKMLDPEGLLNRGRLFGRI